MFDITLLKNNLSDLVGMHQTINPDYPAIAQSLLESKGGRYLQDEHPLLSIENIYLASKNYSKFQYTAFNALTTYSKGQKVSYTDGNNYEYINPVPSSGNLPTDETYWAVVDAFSDYLMRRKAMAIQNVMDKIINDKKLKGLVKSIYDNVLLFDDVARVQNKVINSGKFVGLKVRLKNHRSLITVINKIGLQFSANVTNLPIHIYHSSQEDPIFTIQVSTAKAPSFSWVAVNDTVLRYLSDDYDVGGDFYIGYFQDDLDAQSSQAIRKDYGFQEPCRSCNERNYRYYNSWSEFTEVHPFEINGSDFDGNTMVDNSKVRYVYNNNFGLNLNLSSKCDLTDFFIEEKRLFSEAMAKQWALLIMNDLAFSTRDNTVSKEVRNMALFEISDKQNDNIFNHARETIKALSFDFSELNDACLPCNDEYGLSWGQI
jgi:hypothetical protein